MKTLAIDVWSDIACPWCYVGKRHLEAALARFEHASAVTIHWRAFELDPSAPAVLDTHTSYAERLARKYGRSVAQAEGMIAHMVSVAAQDGLEMRFDRIRPGNTFDGHRLIHLAAAQGRGGEAKERLLRAYFTEGLAVGDRSTLQALGEELGLDGGAVAEMLASGQHSEAVRGEEAEARRLGISGVPFFVLGGRYGVSGAQPADVLLQALRTAWDALPEEPETLAGETCGPEGCS